MLKWEMGDEKLQMNNDNLELTPFRDRRTGFGKKKDKEKRVQEAR